MEFDWIGWDWMGSDGMGWDETRQQEYILAHQHEKQIVPIYTYIYIYIYTHKYVSPPPPIYVMAWNKNVVIILVGKDGFGHDNIFNK